MENSAVYFLLFAAVCTKDIWCKNVSDKHDVRIVGGNETRIEYYPHQAFLSLDYGRKQGQCGGSILNENYILTAAHCLMGVQSISVRIGSTNKNSGGQEYNTTDFDSHPFYDDETYDFDVGLVHVEEGMELDGMKTRAIGLVKSGTDPQPREDMIVTGWGLTSEGGTASDLLKEAKVPVVERNECADLLGQEITARMFCAGKKGEDTCLGDAGGPAVAIESGELAGITSFGEGCGRPGKPGVYTRIGQIYIRGYIRAMTGV